MNESKVKDCFWKEVVHTTIYIQNRSFVRAKHNKSPYELWNGRATTVKYFKIFGSPCYIRRDEDNLGKFDPRADEGIFL